MTAAFDARLMRNVINGRLYEYSGRIVYTQWECLGHVNVDQIKGEIDKTVSEDGISFLERIIKLSASITTDYA